MAEKAILFDTKKCMACRACQVACKQWNELSAETTKNPGSYENPPDLSHKTWLRIRFTETERSGKPAWLFSREACLHCTEAACIKVCPPKALYRHELGFVALNKDLCTGDGYCVDACPFHVPRLERNGITGIAKVNKCVMCTVPDLNRIDNGYEPACVKTCPTGALKYGDRDSLVSEGKQKVSNLVAKGYTNAYLYGENELGGLHVMYVLDDSPEAYGLPVNPKISGVTTAWQSVIQPTGLLLGGLTLAGLAMNFVVARRAKLARESAKE